VRITSIHAANVLTFSDMHVSFDKNASLSLIVGANGSGKTNLFRLIKYLIDWTINPNVPNSTFDTALLTKWVRVNHEPASIELGIEWDQEDERHLLSTFLHAAFASEAFNMTRALHMNNASDVENGRAWAAFLDYVPRLIPASELDWLFRGELGLSYRPPDTTSLYFKPSGIKDWAVMLDRYNGIVTSPVHIQSDSTQTFQIENAWVDSLSAEEVSALKAFLAPDGSSESTLPSLSFSWSKVIAAYQSSSRQVDTSMTVMPLYFQIGQNTSQFSRYAADLFFPLGIPRYGHSEQLGLRRIVSHLLRERVTATDDLLSPPETEYSPSTWGSFASPLASRHLGAHLLALRLGQDEERSRFSSIQKTFRRLTGREFDVVSPAPKSDETKQIITLVQRGMGDPRSTPLLASGSGFLEVAYLSTALHSPRSHVLLLDEPGRSLHPQSLIRLQRFIHDRCAQGGAQTLLVTHSPYLVDSAHLESVYRVWRDPDGRSCVSQLCGVSHDKRAEEAADQESLPNATLARSPQPSRREIRRQDRWGRSPNWPALLFSTVVLLVDGETELGALPEWYAQRYGEPLEALGASVLCVGGKGSNGAAFQDLDGFRIPWVALVDGDSIAAGGGNVWHELATAARLSPQEANAAQAKSFVQQIERLRDEFSIFVVGNDVNENFEEVVKREVSEANCIPRGLGGSKVLRGMWMAQRTACPSFLHSPFERLREIARIHLDLSLDEGP